MILYRYFGTIITIDKIGLGHDMLNFRSLCQMSKRFMFVLADPEMIIYLVLYELLGKRTLIWETIITRRLVVSKFYKRSCCKGRCGLVETINIDRMLWGNLEHIIVIQLP